jgi:cell division protein FtsQ
MSPKNSETENEFYRSSSSRISVRSADTRAGADNRDRSPADDGLDDRFIDLEPDDDVAFLRAQRRVPVRRGALPKKTANRLKQALMAAAVLGVTCGGAGVFYAYATGSPRFRVQASDNIEISGVKSVPRMQVMEVFGGDIGRNIFFVSLPERKKQLQEIPWIESAAVMRLLPNRLKVQVQERTPVAFVRIGPKASLIDGNGVVLDMPAKLAKKYSFPVIVGMEEAEPLSTRAARMKIFTNLMEQLDSAGARYSDDLSEVDLSDPEDVKITVADSNGAVLVHLGISEPGEMAFLERYKVYLAHAREWRAQFNKLESVDLRYDRQVIVNPDAGKSQREARRERPSPPPKPVASSPARKSAGVSSKRYQRLRKR